MKVLVCCEFSGVVLDAFLAEGHDAYSSDLLPTESRHFDRHFQGDGLWLLREPWDLVIAHPPCQRLTKLNDAHPRNRTRPNFWTEFAEAVQFFKECLNANAPQVAVENPMMHRWARRAIGKYTIRVQPFEFGDPYKKATGFWCKGFPPLLGTCYVPDAPPLLGTMAGARRRSVGKGGVAAVLPDMWSGPERTKQRSRFHPGMAMAMAKQWGSYGG